MTLILSLAHPSFVIQVSDRLVSLRDGGEWDPLANKTVVLRARDAIATLSYSGLSYIGSQPTDEWLAFTLAEEQPPAPDFPGPHITSHLHPWRDVGDSMRRLRAALDRSVDLQRIGWWEAPQVVLVGWKWKRKNRRIQLRRIGWHIQAGQAGYILTSIVPRRYEGRFHLSAMPYGWVTSTELQVTGDACLRASADGAVEILCNLIRAKSFASTERIGPHCMAVTLDPGRFPQISAEFIPFIPSGGPSSRGPTGAPEAYSPALVGPGPTWPALILEGMPSQKIGNFMVNFGTPAMPTDSPILMGFVGQRRRRPPS